MTATVIAKEEQHRTLPRRPVRYPDARLRSRRPGR